MIAVTTIAAALLAAQAVDAPRSAAGPVAQSLAPESETKQLAPVTPALIPLAPSAAPVKTVLEAGTPVFVMLDQDLTTTTSRVGDTFQVTVMHDVGDGDTVVIPQGTIGRGEVTFVTRRGGFGKGGIIGITLRDLALGDRRVALDGHYREEGKTRSDTTAATFFAVGIFAGFIKGNNSGIPKGRALKARTGEAIAYTRDSAALPRAASSTEAALPPGSSPAAPGAVPTHP